MPQTLEQDKRQCQFWIDEMLFKKQLWSLPARQSKNRRLQFRPQHTDHVIGGDHANQLLFIVEDWERKKIVLIE